MARPTVSTARPVFAVRSVIEGSWEVISPPLDLRLQLGGELLIRMLVRSQGSLSGATRCSLGVLELLHDVALERFTEMFCNTSATCGACRRRCSEPC
jgi:hypothetical protein